MKADSLFSMLNKSNQEMILSNFEGENIEEKLKKLLAGDIK